jgi:putative membrane protein
MSILHRTVREGNGQSPPAAAGASASAEQLTPPQPTPPAAASPGRVPRTRTGAAWVALIAAALLAVLLIVFLVQNTHSTEISFLWMTTSTPLAIALLIAAVGSVLLTLIVGTARISQLRRLVRKNRT